MGPSATLLVDLFVYTTLCATYNQTLWPDIIRLHPACPHNKIKTVTGPLTGKPLGTSDPALPRVYGAHVFTVLEAGNMRKVSPRAKVAHKIRIRG